MILRATDFWLELYLAGVSPWVLPGDKADMFSDTSPFKSHFYNLPASAFSFFFHLMNQEGIAKSTLLVWFPTKKSVYVRRTWLLLAWRRKRKWWLFRKSNVGPQRQGAVAFSATFLIPVGGWPLPRLPVKTHLTQPCCSWFIFASMITFLCGIKKWHLPALF